MHVIQQHKCFQQAGGPTGTLEDPIIREQECNYGIFRHIFCRSWDRNSRQRKARQCHDGHHKPPVLEHRHGPGPTLSIASVSLCPLKCGGKCGSPPAHPGNRDGRLRAGWLAGRRDRAGDGDMPGDGDGLDQGIQQDPLKDPPSTTAQDNQWTGQTEKPPGFWLFWLFLGKGLQTMLTPSK